MVVAVLQHGLGNQLFQYATGRAVAARRRTPLLLDATRFSYIDARRLDLPKLRLRARVLPDALSKLLTPGGGTHPLKSLAKNFASRLCPTTVDAERGYDPDILESGRSCRLDGYWQSEKYFAHLRAFLLEELEPWEPLPAPLAELARRLASEPSVAVHVRRGDLVTSPHYAETVGTLGSEYYEEALRRLRERLPEARVYLFSDDPAWCERSLPRVLPTETVSGQWTHSALEDLTLMKHCRHFVVANSTFSWWAAWLGNHPSKQVIAPANFFRAPRAMDKDLLPATWETAEPCFEPVAAR